MIWVLLAVLALVVAVVTVQTRRGRLADRCCCPADPALDLRMRAAFEDDPAPGVGGAAGPACSQPSGRRHQ